MSGKLNRSYMHTDGQTDRQTGKQTDTDVINIIFKKGLNTLAALPFFKSKIVECSHEM